jgi:catechol 2,3-dioxygenase-like lactoylglutathione lyase family enzyme
MRRSRPQSATSVLAATVAAAAISIPIAALSQSIPPPAPAVTAGLPTARNVDHVGFSVPDLEQATQFFVEVLGAQVLMTGGPWADPEAGSFARILGVHPRASIKVAMLRLGPVTSVELVEFTSPDQRKVMPKPSDWGAAHLAIFVDDIEAATAALRQKGVTVLEGPVTNGPGPIAGSRYIYFVTPWGLPMELEQRSGPLPYEAPGRRPYGPASSWDWRPSGEVEGEIVRFETFVANSGNGTRIGHELASAETAIRSLPGTFEYRWYRSPEDPQVFRSYGRFASAAAAELAKQAVETRLSAMGRIISHSGIAASPPSLFDR